MGTPTDNQAQSSPIESRSRVLAEPSSVLTRAFSMPLVQGEDALFAAYKDYRDTGKGETIPCILRGQQ